jgi:outer membrane protein assembly factor BamD (BamD/ComL family)
MECASMTVLGADINIFIFYLSRDKDLTLANNFVEVIETLKDISLEHYEFPRLSPLETVSEFNIGA